MSELSDELGLTSARAREARKAWKEIQDELRLSDDAMAIAQDFLMEHSSRVKNGLPPGVIWWNSELETATETIGVFPPPFLSEWKFVSPKVGMALIRMGPRYMDAKGLDREHRYRMRAQVSEDDEGNLWVDMGFLVPPEGMRIGELDQEEKDLIWEPWFHALGLEGDAALQFRQFLFDHSDGVRPSRERGFYFPPVPLSRGRTSRSPIRDDADWIRANIWHHRWGYEGEFIPGLLVEDEGRTGSRVWFFHKIPVEDQHLLGLKRDR